MWSTIATVTHVGRLAISSKVSPRNSCAEHVICVYTRDYTDEVDVRMVRQGLLRLGVEAQIGYKPDIYTHCGLFDHNA